MIEIRCPFLNRERAAKGHWCNNLFKEKQNLSVVKPSVVIMGAMPQEIAAYREQFRDQGNVHIVESKIGKVNCAAATARAIELYKPRAILFTGVGGALEATLRQGDVTLVVGAIDVDVDATAFDRNLLRGQLPFERNRVHFSDRRLIERAFSYPEGGLKRAYAATSDTFRNEQDKQLFVRQQDVWGELLPYNAPCYPNVCDMETSAFLQTANNAYVPALAIRAISDTLDGDAMEEFGIFMNKAVEHYVPLVRYIVDGI